MGYYGMDVVQLSQYALIPVAATLAIRVLHPVARRYRFVDMPDERKRHGRPTPLIGGYAVLVGLALAMLVTGLISTPSWQVFLVATTILAVMGSIDDALDVSARLRFLMQSVVVTGALVIGKVTIEQLGFLAGSELISLGGGAGLIFTVICALASINAYNMIDGIDGLAASVTALTLLGMALLAGVAGVTGFAALTGLLVVTLLVFLAFNLEIPGFRGHKVFLGDAGSTSLGFVIVWLLAVASQTDMTLRPITAVWLVGLPIVDMLGVFARRAVAGKSPFGADRTHIHHLLLARGFSSRAVLVLLAGVQAVLVGVGLVGEWLGWSEAVMTVSAIVVGILYFCGTLVLAATTREKRVAVRSGV